ncbi:MAG: transcription elongation factor GreA [Deltaproteobacteria bacterium]|nr:transcription elongation factor GreA [Deltaproteobacteria bacterium]
MDRSPMTEQSHKLLQTELQKLKAEDRPRIVKAIEEARAHGDLSENAEYHAAKEAQGLLEAKIRLLEERLSTAQVIDVSKLSGNKVVFGATVVISDGDTDEEKTVTIVGEDEANADLGYISYKSPLARALIGKSSDDFIQVRLPAGERTYEIKEVRFDYGS